MTQGNRSRLAPAHEGYRYQDLMTAYTFARSLIERYAEVIADCKVVEDDRFDDLGYVKDGRSIRQQIKSSPNPERQLKLSDFTSKDSTLRIDRLVRSYTRAQEQAADEYRLCATWAFPDEEPLLSVLEHVDAAPTIEGFQGPRFKLHAEQIWPVGTSPAWSWLGGENQPEREEFLRFCDRFIIELELPLSSESFFRPGPFEQVLLRLLTNQIGIGRYPNQDRRPADVAAVLVALASLARTKSLTLTPSEIEAEIDLRTDYGRISQKFPLDQSVFLNRRDQRLALKDSALRGNHQLLVGPPGAGKSWEATQLAKDLRAAGALVARHYCYLEPGDEKSEQRITSDVFFANLLAEITDTEPSLRDLVPNRYSAGINELEDILAQAARPERPVVLIVDGIDHISRVRTQARTVSQADTDIIEQLASLKLPSGIALIICTQPGEHIAPLRERFRSHLIERRVMPWSANDIAALAKRLLLTKVFEQFHYQEVQPVLDLLASRSEGNPLYATYLVRSLIQGLLDGTIGDPLERLQQAPAIEGDIGLYYAYLYQLASPAAHMLADVLGLIDFGVTEADLQEMLPPLMRSWIPSGLRSLAPILTQVSSQGGFRIYHESFRRFMTEELERQGRSVANALEPVISWLERRGFYQDAKSYRFLLPALQRAGLLDRALSLVNYQFVSKSVAACHPREAIERNLIMSSHMAVQLLRWPDLIRHVELHRSLDICFEQKLYDPLPYWSTYLQIFGPHPLAERLLFDGQPTLSANVGLILCSLIENAGAVPPWREYLSLYKQQNNRRRQDDETIGSDKKRTELRLRGSLASIQGQIRTAGFDTVRKSIISFLTEDGTSAPLSYIHGIASTIARYAGVAALEEVIAGVAKAVHSSALVPPAIVVQLRLALAQALAVAGEADAATTLAQSILNSLEQPTDALACRQLGADYALASAHACELASVDLGFGQYHQVKADSVQDWVASARLLAKVRPAALDEELMRLDGVGWYRCWLRFVIRLAQAEAAKLTGDDAPSAIIAFKELTQDLHPFAGKPRACDLYVLHESIAETIAWGISLLASDEEWRDALEILEYVIRKVSTRLDHESAGPIHIENILELLLPYVGKPELGEMIQVFAEDLIAHGDELGAYFEVRAERTMLLARILSARGDEQGARKLWEEVAVYLGGYGFRKDITIYDLVESIPALARIDPSRAFDALVTTQPLVYAVTHHTDGSETRHAINEWFRSLLACDVATGLTLLSESMLDDKTPVGWQLERALLNAARAASSIGEPALVWSLYATLPFEAESDGESERYANDRLLVIVRLLDQDLSLGKMAYQSLVAQVTGDGRRYTQSAIKQVKAFGAKYSLPYSGVDGKEGVSGGSQHSPGSGQAPLDTHSSVEYSIAQPLFSPTASVADLMASLRREGAFTRTSDERWNQLINALGYRLIVMAAEGCESDVLRILLFFARHVYVLTGTDHPLGDIARGLERHNYPRLAAVAYALAYAYTFGDGGYRSLGDDKHEPALLRGVELARAETLQTLAQEIGSMLERGRYRSGITKHIVERAVSWGQPEVAQACWQAAYEVIAHRLPVISEYQGILPLFRPADLPNWSVDEALMAVLLSRMSHPVLSHKISALAGLDIAVVSCPETVSGPLHKYFKGVPLSSQLLILEALRTVEQEPYQVTRQLSDVLTEVATSILWGPRKLARYLLDRCKLPLPSEVYPAVPDITNLNLPPEREQEILSIDEGQQLETMTPLWHSLPSLVARRTHQLLEEASDQDEHQRRLELAVGRDGRAWPPTPVLFGEREILEKALHEVLNGLKKHLWVSGMWREGLEESVLNVVLPNTALHLALHASRVARPSYPEPQEASAGLQSLQILYDDPIYSGWYRIGYIERCWTYKDNRPRLTPTPCITVMAGAIALPLGWQPQAGDWPFQKGEVQDWWETDVSPPIFPAQIPPGILTRMADVQDWLGAAQVLVPLRELRTYIQLIPPKYGQPLVWRDDQGEPAIVLRVWQIRDPEQIWAEPLKYEGSDLLVRPDLLPRITSLMGNWPRELCVVHHS